MLKNVKQRQSSSFVLWQKLVTIVVFDGHFHFRKISSGAMSAPSLIRRPTGKRGTPLAIRPCSPPPPPAPPHVCCPSLLQSAAAAPPKSPPSVRDDGQGRDGRGRGGGGSGAEHQAGSVHLIGDEEGRRLRRLGRRRQLHLRRVAAMVRSSFKNAKKLKS